MKKVFQLLAMLLVLALCVVSCSNGSSSDDDDNDNTGGTYAPFAGTEWTFMESVLTFNEDGSGTITSGSPIEVDSFTYTVRDNVAYITLVDHESGEVEHGTFTLSSANATKGVLDNPDPVWGHLTYTKL